MNRKTLVCLILIALVESLSSAAHAQTFSVIHSFTYADGAGPEAGVTLRGGNLYGTTTNGGAPYADGNAYELARSGDNWALSSLHIFTGGYPALARPVFGPDTHLYGTVSSGTVFKLTPPVSICKVANCFWTEYDLYQYQYSGGLNGFGYGDLVWDQKGNIYGTAECGGQPPCFGGVYELSFVGNNWVATLIYYFQNVDGPESGVIFDNSGNLFGAAGSGGYNPAIIYELQYVIGVGWTESTIYNFTNAADGPPVGVTFDNSGNLFGATSGIYFGNSGTIFELSPAGDTWMYRLVYSFSGKAGCGPERPLTVDAAGSLYGTTVCGGAYQKGNVFKLTNTPNGWVYTSLYDFTGGSDGALPFSNVTIDGDGTLYGTTSSGGTGTCGGGCGVVWMIKP